MENVYWLAFYEGGRFSHYVRNPYQTWEQAAGELAAMAEQLARVLPIRYDIQNECFTFDRYGTPCMVRIEKKED